MKLRTKNYKFNLRGINMNEEITCPVCEVKKINGDFYFNFSLKSKEPKPSTPDSVATKVCRYAKKSGCINIEGKVDERLGVEALPDWESVTKKYMNSITDYPD